MLVRRIILAGVLLLTVLLGVWVYIRIQSGKEAFGLQPEQDRAGLQELLLENPDGSRFPLSALRGKPVIVDVWASWCGPCLENLPRLVALKNAASEEVQIVGLNVDGDGWGPVESFRRRFPEINFPLVKAHPEPLVVRTLVTIPALGPVSVLPTAFLVDSEGRLAGKYVGIDQMDRLHRDVRALLR